MAVDLPIWACEGVIIGRAPPPNCIVSGAEAAIPFTPAEERPAQPADGQPSTADVLKGRRRRVNARRPYKKQVRAVDGGDSYMILCLDLSVGGMRIEHNYLVTDNGSEQLSNHTIALV